MDQRDLIMDQIEQLGRVLSEILADFLGFKSKGQVSLGIEISTEQLKSKLDIDINKLITFSKNELKDYLQKRKLAENHLKVLAQILMEMGESKIESNAKDAKINLEKSLEILEIADEASKTFSFDRINIKTKIENMLQ